MAEMPVVTSESTWMIVLIVMMLAVGAIIFAMNPQFRETTSQFLCISFYDINYFFGGVRAPIEICGAGTTTTTTTLHATPTSTLRSSGVATRR